MAAAIATLSSVCWWFVAALSAHLPLPCDTTTVTFEEGTAQWMAARAESLVLVAPDTKMVVQGSFRPADPFAEPGLVTVKIQAFGANGQAAFIVNAVHVPPRQAHSAGAYQYVAVLRGPRNPGEDLLEVSTPSTAQIAAAAMCVSRPSKPPSP
jgi:hypothetical protein